MTNCGVGVKVSIKYLKRKGEVYCARTSFKVASYLFCTAGSLTAPGKRAKVVNLAKTSRSVFDFVIFMKISLHFSKKRPHHHPPARTNGEL